MACDQDTMSEADVLAQMEVPELRRRLTQSLAGHGDLPTVHSSLGESAADVWASFFEKADPKSVFCVRLSRIVPELLQKLLRAETLPGWSREFCILLQHFRCRRTRDLLRRFLESESFRDSKYETDDIDLELLFVAAQRVRTATDQWRKLLEEKRYCDTAHLALSVNMPNAIRHLQVAVNSMTELHRRASFVRVVLDHWYEELDDASELLDELTSYESWNHTTRDLIRAWWQRRKLDGSPFRDDLESKLEAGKDQPARYGTVTLSSSAGIGSFLSGPMQIEVSGDEKPDEPITHPPSDQSEVSHLSLPSASEGSYTTTTESGLLTLAG